MTLFRIRSTATDGPADRPGEAAAEKALEPEMRPWTVLKSQQEAEGWIAGLNHELQQIEEVRSQAARSQHAGHGVCFTLAHGGTITLHTAADGDIVLDLDAEAEWVAPLIVAATGVAVPRGAIWLIPGDRLVELIMGLNSLIAFEKLVFRHNFRGR
jgi:hypothetical protein